LDSIKGRWEEGKLKRDDDLRMATCFENYGFLSPTQNGTNYTFIKNKSAKISSEMKFVSLSSYSIMDH
jgi:hypothetical protein